MHISSKASTANFHLNVELLLEAYAINFWLKIIPDGIEREQVHGKEP